MPFQSVKGKLGIPFFVRLVIRFYYKVVLELVVYPKDRRIGPRAFRVTESS